MYSPGKESDAHRQGLQIGIGQDDEREEKLVPCVNEDQQRGGENSRRRNRQHDLIESLKPAATVDERGFLDLVGHLTKKSRENPSRQGQRKRDVGRHQPSIGVEPIEMIEQVPHRAGNGDLRKHRDGKQ